jgi:hypothetical protein
MQSSSHGAIAAATALLVALAACGAGEDAGDEGAAACEDGDPGAQRHGTDCLCCHAGQFSVAGSLAEGEARARQIVVTDAAGATLIMAPNPYRNFFRHVPVAPPLRAWIVDDEGRTYAMQAPIDDGACNRCHREGVGPGPLRVP